MPGFASYDAPDLATVVTATGAKVTTCKDKSGLGREAAVGGDTVPVSHVWATCNGKPAIYIYGIAGRRIPLLHGETRSFNHAPQARHRHR